jgi:hypothetical protein
LLTTDRSSSSIGALDILFKFLMDPILDFCKKNVLPPLEPKLLVLCEIIGEDLKMVCSAYKFGKT